MAQDCARKRIARARAEIDRAPFGYSSALRASKAVIDRMFVWRQGRRSFRLGATPQGKSVSKTSAESVNQVRRAPIRDMALIEFNTMRATGCMPRMLPQVAGEMLRLWRLAARARRLRRLIRAGLVPT